MEEENGYFSEFNTAKANKLLFDLEKFIEEQKRFFEASELLVAHEMVHLLKGKIKEYLVVNGEWFVGAILYGCPYFFMVAIIYGCHYFLWLPLFMVALFMVALIYGCPTLIFYGCPYLWLPLFMVAFIFRSVYEKKISRF